MERFVEVAPGDLYLPSGRFEGPSLKKYRSQVTRFGGGMEGMPAIQVTEGRAGRLMIKDGVTRAVRLHNLAPHCLVRVAIIDYRPNADFRGSSEFETFRRCPDGSFHARS